MSKDRFSGELGILHVLDAWGKPIQLCVRVDHYDEKKSQGYITLNLPGLGNKLNVSIFAPHGTKPGCFQWRDEISIEPPVREA